jgi:hypothetical protein
MTETTEGSQTKRVGIYSLLIKDCGCKVKSYVGGKVVIEGCNNGHETEVFHKCPSCGKIFHGKRGKGRYNNNGKTEMKACAWSHAQ